MLLNPFVTVLDRSEFISTGPQNENKLKKITGGLGNSVMFVKLLTNRVC